ncbi:hypothetical protein POTOM_057942 [Populus tomentosa]|uniref:PNPLA domain-containing protein n=1 Tax=Populus tomentosa TaxID=118781 RepID=A0A8X7XUY1_POPTO|nr:hypothetical protein POTOM_057942 [Populus tomentosa]
MWKTRMRGLQIILTLLLGQAQVVLCLPCLLLRMQKNDLRLQQKILSSFIWRRAHSYFLKPPNSHLKTTTFSKMKLRSTLYEATEHVQQCYQTICHEIIDPLIATLRYLSACTWLPKFLRERLGKTLLFPKYDGVKLHEVINDKMGQKLLSDALTNVIIPTFDIKLFQPIIFSSLEVIDSSYIPKSRKAQRDKSTDARIADVCIGTSAAPSYFPPYFFKTTVDFNLADGGLEANDPSLIAVCEVMKEQKTDGRKPLILSLGTGAANQSDRYEVGSDPSKWGILRWLWYSENNGCPLIEILTTASDEMISTYISSFFHYCGWEDNYYRLQAEMKLSDAKMDDASQENLKKLVKIGEDLAAKHDAELEALAQKLIENRKARNMASMAV